MATGFLPGSPRRSQEKRLPKTGAHQDQVRAMREGSRPPGPGGVTHTAMLTSRDTPGLLCSDVNG